MCKITPVYLILWKVEYDPNFKFEFRIKRQIKVFIAKIPIHLEILEIAFFMFSYLDSRISNNVNRCDFLYVIVLGFIWRVLKIYLDRWILVIEYFNPRY